MKKIDFKAVAKNATTLSQLMENREKVDMDVIIALKKPITIIGVDVAKINNEEFPVCIYAEEKKNFFFGGKVIMNVVNSWLQMYEGDIDMLNHDLAESGGVKMLLSHGTTKNGNDLTKVEIL